MSDDGGFLSRCVTIKAEHEHQGANLNLLVASLRVFRLCIQTLNRVAFKCCLKKMRCEEDINEEWKQIVGEEWSSFVSGEICVEQGAPWCWVWVTKAHRSDEQHDCIDVQNRERELGAVVRHVA